MKETRKLESKQTMNYGHDDDDEDEYSYGGGGTTHHDFSFTGKWGEDDEEEDENDHEMVYQQISFRFFHLVRRDQINFIVLRTDCLKNMGRSVSKIKTNVSSLGVSKVQKISS